MIVKIDRSDNKLNPVTRVPREQVRSGSKAQNINQMKNMKLGEIGDNPHNENLKKKAILKLESKT